MSMSNYVGANGAGSRCLSHTFMMYDHAGHIDSDRIPANRGNPDVTRDRAILQSLIANAPSEDSIYICVEIPGLDPQKISRRLLNKVVLSKDDSEPSRLVDLFYKPPVLKAVEAQGKISLDLVFASSTFYSALPEAIQEKDKIIESTTEFSARADLNQRAFDWLNDHAHDLAQAPIDKVEPDLALDLLKAVLYLDMPGLIDVCLRRVLDKTAPAILVNLKTTNLINFACSIASSQLVSFRSRFQEIEDPVEKYTLLYREIVSKAARLYVPLTPNTPLASILGPIQQAIKDHDLVVFFEKLLVPFPRPALEGNTARDAAAIRERMRNHVEILKNIRFNNLSILYPKIDALPEEIYLSDGLQKRCRGKFEGLNNSYSLDLALEANTPLSEMFEKIKQGITDICLLDFYIQISRNIKIPDDPYPSTLMPVAEIAGILRTWMKNNRENLNTITNLNLTVSCVNDLPDEINLLVNLEELIMNHPRLGGMPDYLNLPKLKRLNFSNTSITRLPDMLNLPSLEELNLVETKVIALPASFDPPNGMKLHCEDALWANLSDEIKRKIQRVE